jgi:hypothetical protein
MHHYGYSWREALRLPLGVVRWLHSQIARHEAVQKRSLLQITHTSNPKDLDSRLYYIAHPEAAERRQSDIKTLEEFERLGKALERLGAK